MNVVPFKAEHFWAIKPQLAQGYVPEHVSDSDLKPLEVLDSFTAFVDDKPVCCFGWLEQHKSRATIWGYLAKDAGEHLVAITRIGKRMVEGLTYRRIEMEVDFEFTAGHRWAHLLGFTLEAPLLRCTRTDGGNSSLYVRIN